MSFFDILQEMLVLLFSIAAGYLASKLRYLDDATNRKITGILLNFTVPAMILASVLSNDNLPGVAEILGVLYVSVIYYVVAFAFAFVMPHILRGTPGQRGVWRFCMAFSNVGFIGYPVAIALYGPEALFYAVILALPFNVLSYTLGPLMLGGGARFTWKQLCSPCSVAAVAGLVLALTRVQAPAVVTESIDFLGGISIPLSLMVVGAELARLPARDMLGTPRVWGLTLVRLLVMPLLLAGILSLVGGDPMINGIAVVQMGMPVAVSGSLLTIQYGADSRAMSQSMFLTTLISIVTIPLLAAVLL